MWIYWTKMIWIEKLYLRINTMRCSHNIMRRNQRSSAVPWYRSTYFFYSHRYLKSNKNLLIKISFNWITLRNSKDQSFYMHSRFSEVCFKHQFHIRTTKEDIIIWNAGDCHTYIQKSDKKCIAVILSYFLIVWFAPIHF